MALRYLFLGAHYRDTLNFTWDSLTAARNGLENLRSQVANLKSQNDRTVLSEEKEDKVNAFRNDFLQALSDDLGTPKALAVLWEMLKSNIPSEDKYDLAMSFDEVLGLDLSKSPEKTIKEIPEDIKILFSKRDELRKAKKFDEADEIRKQIEEAGYSVNDTSVV
jgi:cysteinyl-tRNA synthetase